MVTTSQERPGGGQRATRGRTRGWRAALCWLAAVVGGASAASTAPEPSAALAAGGGALRVEPDGPQPGKPEQPRRGKPAPAKDAPAKDGKNSGREGDDEDGGGAGGGAGGDGDGESGAVAFPHPVITEILYAVPTGEEGDADGDGARQATGDEFIELMNPHAKSINLAGYTLQDKSLGAKGGMNFTFPACVLEPGEVAVVFNGFQSAVAGPVGDGQRGPREGHEGFGGARVFSMNATSARVALANAGDLVLLKAPGGRAVQTVSWGAGGSGGSETKPPAARLMEKAPTTSRASVTRGATGVWRVTSGPRRFTPGVHEASGSAAPSTPEAPGADRSPDAPAAPAGEP